MEKVATTLIEFANHFVPHSNFTNVAHVATKMYVILRSLHKSTLQ